MTRWKTATEIFSCFPNNWAGVASYDLGAYGMGSGGTVCQRGVSALHCFDWALRRRQQTRRSSKPADNGANYNMQSVQDYLGYSAYQKTNIHQHQHLKTPQAQTLILQHKNKPQIIKTHTEPNYSHLDHCALKSSEMRLNYKSKHSKTNKHEQDNWVIQRMLAGVCLYKREKLRSGYLSIVWGVNCLNWFSSF